MTYGEMVKYLQDKQEESNYNLITNSKEKKITIMFDKPEYQITEDLLGNLVKRQIEVR